MMRRPAVHAVSTDFDDRNVVLRLALGVIAGMQRFRQVLRRYGAQSSEVSSGTGSDSSDDPALFVVLGLVSLSSTLMTKVRIVPKRGARRRDPGGRGSARAAMDLLR